MESGRLDLDSGEAANGAAKAPTVAATYKPLPDDDAGNWQESKEGNIDTMGKPNGEGDMDDGAQEKMLKDETKITPTKDATEVKFISENGDAKIDIETVKQTLTGMGKEELMKFANDPFWIRLRWALFVGFWLLWLAMLGGAIAIIVMAPKCSAPQPKEWWEESPIVRLDVEDTHSHSLKDLDPLLDALKEQGIKAISLGPIVKESVAGGTEDFKIINPDFGDLNDLEALIKAANKRDQYIILELDPNHSSVDHPWFKNSVEKIDPYTNYYVWADPQTDSNGVNTPPNNWLSVNGGSAWEWNEQRGQYYLHQFNNTQPDLNYNNPAVVTEFADILTHWLKLGISGFRLANTQYLTEDPELRDEHTSNIPVADDNYESLVHAFTKGRPENKAVLAKWKERLMNETDGKGLFALQEDIGADLLAVYNDEAQLVDLPQNSQFFATADASIDADALHQGISEWLNSRRVPWPGWDLNGNKEKLRERMPPKVADSLTLMTLLLPGTPILTLNDTLSAKEAFATLSKARSGLTFLHGETMTKVVNDTVFVYTRLKSGNPGYLVAYQSSHEPGVVDLSTIPQMSEEINVVAHSPNYAEEGATVKTKLPSNRVPMSPKSTLVLTFVPNN